VLSPKGAIQTDTFELWVEDLFVAITETRYVLSATNATDAVLADKFRVESLLMICAVLDR